MPRSKGREGSARAPRGAPVAPVASTSAGPARPPAAQRRRRRDDSDDEENDEEEEPEEPHDRLRRQPERFTPDGTPIATGFAKRKRKPPRRPDDSPNPNQRRRCDRCERMLPIADFTSARGQLATCRPCRDAIVAAREENRRRAAEEREAGLRQLFRESVMLPFAACLTLSGDEDDFVTM
jgi:hypothetical protein